MMPVWKEVNSSLVRHNTIGRDMDRVPFMRHNYELLGRLIVGHSAENGSSPTPRCVLSSNVFCAMKTHIAASQTCPDGLSNGILTSATPLASKRRISFSVAAQIWPLSPPVAIASAAMGNGARGAWSRGTRTKPWRMSTTRAMLVFGSQATPIGFQFSRSTSCSISPRALIRTRRARLPAT
jgi:hypothetical protein